MSTVILIKQDRILKNSILSGNLDVDKYLQDIKRAQKIYLMPIIGKELYQKLQDDFEDGLTGDYKYIYDEWLEDMITIQSTILYLTHGQYSISNNGVLKTKSEQNETISHQELDYLIKTELSALTTLQNQLVEYLLNSNIPEYKKKIKKINTIGGWLL